MLTSEGFSDTISKAVTLAEGGDVSLLSALDLGIQEPRDAASRAWMVLGRAAWCLYGMTPCAPPTMGTLDQLMGTSPAIRLVAARACALIEKICVLRLDARALSACLCRHDTFSVGLDDPGNTVARRLANVWLALMEGNSSTAALRLEGLKTDAAAAQLSQRLVEATAVQSLIALEQGDVAGALVAARRASRMARTEGLPEGEMLANLVLARVRRYAGRPHLAARIASALAARATPAWQGWISWERILAGEDLTSDPQDVDSPVGAAVNALGGLLAAARSGDRVGFEHHATAIALGTDGWRSFSDEARVLVAALDGERETPVELTAWSRGQAIDPPRGLDGVGSAVMPGVTVATRAMAFVFATPGQLARRFLSAGLGLTPETTPSEAPLSDTGGQIRTDTGLAVLCLAGPDGMNRADFFKAVYGFKFSYTVHRGNLNVLLHRIRKRVEGRGEITRDDEHITLSLSGKVVVADLRCERPTPDRVLALLGAQHSNQAASVARTLGIALRTAQHALAQLVNEGACRMQRTGGSVCYVVDDTTFAEPTPLTITGDDLRT